MTAQRLVIFGCGYIGTAVARAARDRGWSVTALTRNPGQAEVLQALGCEAVVAELAAADWHARIPPAQDFVLNAVSSGGHGLAGYEQSYVAGTRSILRWAAGGCPATFVYTGSTSVYPQAAGERVTEESTVGPGASAAADLLLQTEQLVRESTCFGRWFILRLAGIYGPGRHYLLDQLRAGATVFPGTGRHRLNLAYRDDIVSAILAAFDAPAAVRNTIFNVAGDTAVPKEEVTRWLAAQLGREAPVFARDAAPGAPASPVSVRGRSGPVPDRVIDNSRLRTVLGWRPRCPDFRDGYREIFATGREGL